MMVFLQRRLCVPVLIVVTAGLTLVRYSRLTTHYFIATKAIQEQTVQEFSTGATSTSSKILRGGNNATTNTSSIMDFEHQDGVVIVTKIHGPRSWYQLVQSQCLLKAAYNNRTHYDLLVFVTEPIPDDKVQQLQDLLHPATATVVLDEKTLEQMLDELTDVQRTHLLQSCKVNATSQITWTTPCFHKRYGYIAMQYAWQAEFRTKHMWNHSALANYTYMVWYDSDAFATMKWDRDPVAEFIRHDLVLLFDHFPADNIAGPEMDERYHKAFGREKDTLCAIEMNTATGQLEPLFESETTFHKCGWGKKWKLVHGFFHLTNLDFYRSPVPQRWMHELIGTDTRFMRKYDDQAAVTLPAAVLEPNRSWDMRTSPLQMNLQVLHNGVLDGQEFWRKVNGTDRPGFFGKFWQEIGQHRFKEAIELDCPLRDPGR